ncbi:MAG: MFS transporter [Anaerolineales bacterium]
MREIPDPHRTSIWLRVGRRSLPFALLLLVIEFHDELAYGALGAGLPSIRQDLNLSYAQIGLLLAVPGVFSSILEPVLLLLGSGPRRRALVIGGGLTVGLALILAALSLSFPVLLLALSIAYPAGGAFITLSQATMMDANPGAESRAMASWTFAGTLGALAGPLLLAAALAAGIGWRPILLILAALGIALALSALPARFPVHPQASEAPAGARQLIASLREAVANASLVRWTFLLHVSDLGLDVFTSYLPLYLVDVSGASPSQAALGLVVLQASDILASALLIPVLRRWPAVPLVRASAALGAAAFLAWLLVPTLVGKMLLLVILGFCRAPWYPVLQGEAYASHPGRSAAAASLNSISGPIGYGLAGLLGLLAQQAGIGAAMLMVLASPLVLAALIPSRPGHVQ